MTFSEAQSRLTRLNLTAIALIGMTIIYISLLLLAPSSWLAGNPVWAIHPETIREIKDESLNFFFVLPILNQLGFHGMQAPQVHPLMQAFFNFAEAWIFMFLPLLRLDPRGRKLPTVLIWSLAMFLTNVFLMPYMAARLLQSSEPQEIEQVQQQKGILAQLFGATGLVVGLIAVFWACGVQPEVGGLALRWEYWTSQVAKSRVTLAFCVDLVLFYVFQVWLMGAIIEPGLRSRWLRWVPFWGLASWLILSSSTASPKLLENVQE